MEIIKYAGKHCVKCKSMDRVFDKVELPCDIQTIYVEDAGEDKFQALGVTNLPTVVFKNEDKEERLSGIFSPKQIKEAIEKIS